MTADERIYSHTNVGEQQYPNRLHVCTYDVQGTVLRTGLPKRCRHTGLVTHTHQLLAGLIGVHPNLQLVITQTGAHDNTSELVRTPDGHTVLVQGIRTGFPDLLQVGAAKCPSRVRHFYEATIDDLDNQPGVSIIGRAVRRCDPAS